MRGPGGEQGQNLVDLGTADTELGALSQPRETHGEVTQESRPCTRDMLVIQSAAGRDPCPRPGTVL